jgi:UDP:flavonoid glycosyltransferase YjiC (YdhE family)
MLGLRRYFWEYDEEYLVQLIRNEALEYRNAKINALVQTNLFFTCVLAARVAKIPLFSVTSGTWTPNYYKAKYGTFPDSFENFFTRFIPGYIKNQFANWYVLNHKHLALKIVNRLAKKLDLNLHLKYNSELSLGDYTFACDSMEFLGLKPTKDFPAENYIRPILSDDLFKQETEKEDEIKNHLKKPGRSILISMGSAFDKGLFLRFLKILNQTDYNVVAVSTARLDENKLPNLNDNILLKKFVPSIAKLNKMVDLAIIHGGRGTTYTAAYAGKPVIGIPTSSEQQFNLDCLVRHGMGTRLSKKYFNEKKFLETVEKIFANYDFYFKNAQNLAKKLPPPEGDKNAARRIVEILQQIQQP